MVGILNVDKPKGLSSAQVVGRLRRSGGERRVGHGGTLDPMATGVLPIFYGRATLVAAYLSAEGKSYEARVRLGASSDTDDAEGLLTPAPVPATLAQADVEAALVRFIGAIQQVPPAYSAVKVGGERSYRAARRGEAPVLRARGVRVERIRLVGMEAGQPGPLLVLQVDCGPGFYVRALARDLGRALGTEAHLEALVRTRVGGLRVEEALRLDDAVGLGPGIEARLLPTALALGSLEVVAAPPGAAAELIHGRDLPAGGAAAGAAWARAEDGRVLALGNVDAGTFHPHRLVEVG